MRDLTGAVDESPQTVDRAQQSSLAETGWIPHRLSLRDVEVHTAQGRKPGVYGVSQIGERRTFGESVSQDRQRFLLHGVAVLGCPEAQPDLQVTAH